MSDVPSPLDESPPSRWFSRASLEAAKLTVSRSVTQLGWFVLLGTLLSALLAMSMGLLEFGVIAMAGLVLLLIAVPFLVGRAPGQVSLKLQNDRVVAGGHASLDVMLTNSSNAPLLPSTVEVQVDDEVFSVRMPVVAPNKSATVTLPIGTPRRAVRSIGPATTVRQDPIGMFRRARTDDVVHPLFVHPHTVQVPNASVGLIRDLEGNPTSTIVDADIEFHTVRPYAPGDARRHIHWKTSAKTEQLMVKQFEETKRSRLAILLSTNPSAFLDADEFELAVSVAGSLAARAMTSGRETDVLVSPELSQQTQATPRRVRALTTSTPRGLLDQLSGLALSDTAASVDLLAASAAVSRQNTSLVIAITGSLTSYRSLRAAALPFGADVKFVAITCDASAEPGVRTVGDVTLMQVGVLTDLRQLLIRGALA